MSQPYSVQADITNRTLATLTTQAGWAAGDFTLRISEADNIIDSRLSAMGYALPFATNPSILNQLSIIYARYAIFRDVYAAGAPSDSSAMNKYRDQFEKMMEKIEAGFMALVVSSTGVVISPSSSKTSVNVARNTAAVDDAPGILISSFVSDSDVNDGLSPSESGSDSDEN